VLIATTAGPQIEVDRRKLRHQGMSRVEHLPVHHDAIAAKPLGIHAVGVLTGGFSGEDLVSAGCEAVLSELKDLGDHLQC
jgi:hypothetical protein